MAFNKNKEVKCDIVAQLGVLSEGTKGWKTELNLVSWNGADPKYDIRTWSPDHTKMSKGFTFTEEEMNNLKEIIKSM